MRKTENNIVKAAIFALLLAPVGAFGGQGMLYNQDIKGFLYKLPMWKCISSVHLLKHSTDRPRCHLIEVS